MYKLKQHETVVEKPSARPNAPKLVIISGCTPLGVELAHQLYSADFAVIVIDPHQSALDLLDEGFGGVVFVGEATDPTILEQCQIGMASHLIAAFDDDATNILIGKMADTIFKVPDVKILLEHGSNRVSITGSAIKIICAPEIIAQQVMLDFKSELG